MESNPKQGGSVLATRSVSQWERALLARWYAEIEHTAEFTVSAAYVSERSSDHPSLRNKIVIESAARVAYLIHRPAGESAWVLTCGLSRTDLGRFRTLLAALDAIRPHRASTDMMPGILAARSGDHMNAAAAGR